MILRVERVSKSFGGVQAVAGVSFALPEGTIMALIGPNGAGKTTLFNMINGVIRPDEGRVIFRERNITGLPSHAVARLGLARTHQVVRPLGDLTARENAMAGACFGREHLSRSAAGMAADEALALVGLMGHSDQPAGTLNLSEKKKLEMARALAARPHLLLLDESLAGLNPTEITHMLEIIRRVRSGGVTILMIEHVMQAVMSVSDVVVVLDAGAMIASGTPAEVAADAKVIEAYLGDPRLARDLMANPGD